MTDGCFCQVLLIMWNFVLESWDFLDMVKCCAVRDCINFRGQVNFQSDGYPVNYFAFPNPVKEPDRFVRFCELCQCRQDNRQQLYICSEHFGSDDITGNRLSLAVAFQETLSLNVWHPISSLSITPLSKSDWPYLFGPY